MMNNLWKTSKKGIPSDLEILGLIYDKYYDEYAAYPKDVANRSTKQYVPIDVEQIARALETDVDIVFGRLYFHLEHKYGYEKVRLFALKVGNDTNSVNFPYLASILADMRLEWSKFRLATIIAVASVIISIVSLVISLS